MKRLISLGLFLAMTACSLTGPRTAAQEDLVSPQYRDGKFHNAREFKQPGLAKTLHIMWRFAFHKPADTVPSATLPLQPLTRADLLAAPDQSIWRLGHSTMLMKLKGAFWLTDPVFSERASPVQWAGPKRFHPTPISIEELPPIEGVILSHDHYDHLDYDAIRQLAAKVEHFVTPYGVGARLVEWGIDGDKVHQLDWWQSTTIAGVRLVATPAQHFSGRGISDRNATLWASFVITDGDVRLFFSGDSGYFDGFRQIGEKYGPFDLTMVETGAYDPQWPYVHMQPKESLQAHLDLKGKWMMPVHNGTFDLAMHAWDDPFEQITRLAKEQGVTLATPVMGARLSIRPPQHGQAWWRALPSAAPASGRS